MSISCPYRVIEPIHWNAFLILPLESFFIGSGTSEIFTYLPSKYMPLKVCVLQAIWSYCIIDQSLSIYLSTSFFKFSYGLVISTLEKFRSIVRTYNLSSITKHLITYACTTTIETFSFLQRPLILVAVFALVSVDV